MCGGRGEGLGGEGEEEEIVKMDHVRIYIYMAYQERGLFKIHLRIHGMHERVLGKFPPGSVTELIHGRGMYAHSKK